MITPLASRVGRLARQEGLPLVAFGVFFVAGLVWLLHPWHPVEDLAITELTVRQVGSHPPLYGAYSKLPFHHPGPLLFYYLWVPYQLFGERASALLAASIWFNGAMFALILSLARRLSGQVLPPVLAVAVLLWSRDDPMRLLEPWNPSVGALPMLALVLLAWAMAECKAWALPVAAVLATWVVQAHIQFAPNAVAICAVGLGLLVIRSARDGGWGGLKQLRWPMLTAGVVTSVLWTPVLLDVVVHGSASNPAATIRHYRGPQFPAVSGSDVLNVIRSQLSLHPTWSGGPRPYSFFDLVPAVMAPLAVPLWLLALGAAGARRAWNEVRGMSIALVGLLAGAVALTRVTGPTFGPWYLIAIEAASIAMSALAIASLVASAGSLAARPRVRRVDATSTRTSVTGSVRFLSARSRHAAGVVAAIATVALTIGTVLTLHHLPSDRRSAVAARSLLPAVEAAIGPGRPVFVQGGYEFGGWIHAALVLDLERAGYETYARSPIPHKFPLPLDDRPPANAIRLIVVVRPVSSHWVPDATVVAETRFALAPGDPPMQVYVLTAPLATSPFLTRD